MDYIVKNKNGDDLLVEVKKPSDIKNRIAAYYYVLCQNGAEDDNTQARKAIDYMVYNLSDDDLLKLDKDLSDKDPLYIEVESAETYISKCERLKEYERRYVETQQLHQSISNAMRETVEKYKSFNFDLIINEDINGNTFTYRKDIFPIDEYRKELEEIGNKIKGNTWAVTISADGKLVIY